MKMKDKIKKIILNITLICENYNYYILNFFIQIDNYYEPKEVSNCKEPQIFVGFEEITP